MNSDGLFSVTAIIVGGLAVAWDLRIRRIPNGLTLSAIVSGIAINLLFNRENWLDSVYGMALGFVLFFPFFAVGGLGAGDVKLVMAVGAIWGPAKLVWMILFTALAGGVLSIMKLIREYGVRNAIYHLYITLLSLKERKQRSAVFKPKAASNLYIPYGVAIFAGIVITAFFRQ